MSEKIKLKIATIVADPIHAMDASGQARLIDYKFVRALDKLCRDPLTVGDRHAAGKTLREVRSFVAIYHAELKLLLTKHGQTRSKVLAAVIIEKTEQAKAHPNSKVAQALLMNCATMEREVQELEKKPHLDEYLIEPANVAANEAFLAGDKALRDQEVELIYLNHRIQLSAESKLDGDETVAIEELILLPTAGT